MAEIGQFVFVNGTIRALVGTTELGLLEDDRAFLSGGCLCWFRVLVRPSTWPVFGGVDRERCLVVPVDVGKRSALCLAPRSCETV